MSRDDCSDKQQRTLLERLRSEQNWQANNGFSTEARLTKEAADRIEELERPCAQSSTASSELLSHECGPNMACKVCGSLPIVSATLFAPDQEMVDLARKILRSSTRRPVFEGHYLASEVLRLSGASTDIEQSR